LKERAIPTFASGSLFRQAFSDLRNTWSERKQWRDLFAFLFSILFFQAGFAVVIAFSAIFAHDVLLMSDKAFIQLFIGLQFSAAFGAWSFGQVQDRLGSRPAVMISLFIWIAAVLLAWASYTPLVFQISGLLAGFAMGASQSASRALVGIFCPKGREGEWFGLWGLATKSATVFGMAYYGILIQVVQDRRFAILSTAGLFVVGLLLMGRVNVDRGRLTARTAPHLDS
jgi:UMF1 family MFS transporter